ncbi:hypothetical protein V3O24_12600 [Methylobacter sp. Wu8]|uniref:Uncharacterized protein n=1 Tax=Methylobacter tundripaludum TaxID=173365 RepID=A0A2S6GVT4_9GAMM|nr:hypothetical protein [Methylobacter tundripaludum]MCF7965838.1 hypothetical protein [Methylobacter tundripaludum]MCK9638226.1 hypothetical protein [Methylobacter tundripaludum]PPK69352.1 hypothetical protein B0F88_110138 [Methylobacter tundripaludum]
MTTQNTNTVDSSWTMFIEILSDEFAAKTGFGVYAHITPVDADQAYQQYQLRNAPMRLFVREYVRRYA